MICWPADKLSLSSTELLNKFKKYELSTIFKASRFEYLSYLWDYDSSLNGYRKRVSKIKAQKFPEVLNWFHFAFLNLQ